MKTGSHSYLCRLRLNLFTNRYVRMLLTYVLAVPTIKPVVMDVEVVISE